MRNRSGLRWRIVWTLFLSTALNYINRQTFSLLAPVISQQMHFSHQDLSKIFGSFQVAYAWTWLFGGVLLDFIGTRLGLAIAVVWWSAASVLTAFGSSVTSFSIFRFLLGIGEGFNWPGASKVVAEWFPAKERSVAVAIFDSGSSIGAAIAAASIPIVSLAFGWRSAFVLSGVLGLVWLVIWLKIYRPLAQHPKVTAEERAIIQEGSIEPAGTQRAGWAAIGGVLKNRNTWGILLGRGLTDPMWWFFVFWLPQYLSDARGFSLKQIAMFGWMPFVAADIGNFTGGFLSGWLVKKGFSVVKARKWVCVASCVPMLAGIPAAFVQNPFAALALICVALWGYAAWSTMGLTFPSDLFNANVVGTVTGLSGFAAGMASTGVTLAVGVIVDKFSYLPAFVFVIMLPLVATVSVLVLIRERRVAVV